MSVATTLQAALHSSTYEFSYIIVGSLYLLMTIGNIIGRLVGGKWSDHIMTRKA